MELDFATNKLRKRLSSEKEMVREHGPDNARLLMRRLAVLLAAPSLAEVPTQRPERCHRLLGQREGQYAVDLKAGLRLIFRPDPQPPQTPHGNHDLTAVRRIIILAVEDYH
jgi:toxin HigB-1